MPSLRVVGEVEQALCLVVGEQQPALPADDEHALPDAVQNRVVVFVHPGHLVWSQAVRLPQQPPADERRARRRQGQSDARHDQHQRQLPFGGATHVLRGDAGRDQAHDGPVGRLDGHDGLDQRADGPSISSVTVSPASAGAMFPTNSLPMRSGLGWV